MEKTFKFRLWALTALAFTFVAACGSKPGPAAEGASGSIQAPLYRVELKSLPLYTNAVGTLEPYNQAQISTRIMGNVQEVLVREGQPVKQGQTLLRLDMRDTQSRVEQSEAMLAAANSQFANAEAYYNRIKSLYDDKSATKQALDNAEAQYEGAKAQVSAAKSGIDGARSNLSYALITAPFSGFVTSRNVDPGDMAAPGMPLLVLEQQDSLKIVATLNEQDVHKVATGDTAWVETGQESSSRRPARIEAVVPSADPRTRAFRVKLVLGNRDGALKSGMFARVGFRTGSIETLALPEAAIVRQGELTGVFTVDGNGLTRLRWLSLGRASDGMVEVLSGLSPGETVVLADGRLIREGEKVQEVSR